ncbi:winged helix-turn-helix domain-containing protein [Sessilibacter corallicola]|uniref:winged helix-turn-helix domain-containing protein n=1 Tax=Sessilibacter corallicola TaxID=2904075 RepID=UPI001E5E4DA5|nr:winged helix-turn-helix domain-containing protein [Sessilibacter corallicola]MCE2028883.1 winged helix-turn-helix domain-containing protein [Sessilibacter corallicola]
MSVEPKLIEVLCYLIVQRDRYVPLAELHDELWAGRIVTDTAVRRTISKLRSILEDDTYNPQFIKSLPKRGYKMVASVEILSELTGIQHDTITQAAAENLSAPKSSNDYINDDNSANKENLGQSKNLQGETSPTSQIPEISTTDESDKPVDSAIHTPTHSVDEQVLETRGAGVSLAGNATSQINRPGFKITALQIWCIAILAIVVTALATIDIDQVIEQQSSENDSLVKSIEVIETFPSNKTDFDISDDGTKLAFTARMSENMGYQLFIKDLVSGSIEQLTDREENLEEIQFLPGSQEIVYTSIEEDSFALKRRAVNKDNKEIVTTLYKSESFIAGLSRQDSKSSIFFRNYDLENGHEKIRKLNTLSSSLEEFSIVDNSGKSIEQFRYSPNGEALAYSIQHQRDNPELQFIVKHLDTNTEQNIDFSKNLGPQFLRKFEWLDNRHIVVLTSKAIYKLDSITLKYEQILPNSYNRYWNLEVISPTEVLLIRNEPLKRYVIEFDTETMEVLDQFNINSLRRPTYGPNGSFYATRFNEDDYTLINYDPKTRKEQTLFNSEVFLLVIGNLDDRFEDLLIKTADTAFIYNTKDKSRKIIIKTGFPIITFELSNSKTRAFYSEIIEGIRKVGYFDLLSGEKVFLMENVLMAAESNEGGYFFVQIDGSVLKTDQNLNKIAVIDTQFPDRFRDVSGNYRLQIRDNKAFWVQIKNAERTFNVLNLDTNILKIQSFPLQNTIPITFISPDAKKMILIREEERLEIIEKLTLKQSP